LRILRSSPPPLTKLTTKAASKIPFKWSEECENSFIELKRQLCSAPLLAYPQCDREFTLYTDASDVGLGVVLSQHDDNGIERVVAYASRSLRPRERNYATTEKEALAIHYGTQYFRLYLLGVKFTITTDPNALRWLNTIEPKGRIARWLMDLQEFEFSVQHRAGKSHCNADALSRLVNKKCDGANETSASCMVSSVIPDWKRHAKRFTTLPLTYSLVFLLLIWHTIEWTIKLLSWPRQVSETLSLTPAAPIFQPKTGKAEPISVLPDGYDNINSVTVNPTINLHEAQQQDAHIANILELKRKKKPRPDLKEWKDDPILKNFWYNYDRLFIHNGLLVRSPTNSTHIRIMLLLFHSL
jgi:hypothetical protein